MRSRLLVIFVALAIAGAACSKKSNNASGGATPSAGASATSTPSSITLPISVDNKNPNINEAFLSYFPATATVHPGDTLSFGLVDTGEPHTVTFGTLVDAAVNAYNADPNPNAPSATTTAADAKLPNLLPQGPGPSIKSAALDCSLTSGPVPTATACTPAQQTLGDFDGTEAYYNSGWLSAGTTFTVHVAPTTQPGSYHYLCLLHREPMQGVITVVAATQSIPSVADQTAAGQAQLTREIAALQPAVGPLSQGILPGLSFIPTGTASAATVIAGSGTQDSNDLITSFGPSPVTTTVNGTVTWYVFGPHTISFNVPATITGARKAGTADIDPAAESPAGGPGQSPPSNANPNPKPGIAETINGGSFDGTGFRSSGTIVSFPPALTAYKLKFTKAGTYTYQCIIHPGMAGVVVVQ